MFALIALVATLHLTTADNGKTFTVKPQTQIVLTLPTNLSTGYRWDLAWVTDVNHHVRYVSYRYVEPEKNLPGAPGRDVWRFRATSKGTEVLAFQYVRPWEKNKPVRRFRVTIRVS
ncbi:MAG TPA: protease inhibitor I42 family protein [Gaiellaceae bacterium]|nr:protease inhibitor I42 family protein [Gaiellaceae bacterium]